MAFEASFETDDSFTASFGNKGGGGSDVRITPVLTEGIHIAGFSIDGVSGELFAPDNAAAFSAIERTLAQVIEKIGGLGDAYRFFRFYVARSARGNNPSNFANVAELKITDEDGVDVSRLPGAIYTASSYYGETGNNAPWCAFDRRPDTFWETDWKNAKSYTNWIAVELPEAKRPVGFSIMPRPPEGANQDYWSDFLFQASVDGARWLTLYTATGLLDGWEQGVFRDFTL